MSLNVGCRNVDLNDPVQGVKIPLRLLHSTRADARTERFGPYELDVATDAPVEGDRLPLVVISHGGGGSSLTYRDLAAGLARSGYVVALPEHPGDWRGDGSLSGKAANLENRPRHICLTMDAAFADPVIGPRLLPGRVALIGHSMGGYTALAVAGGKPYAGARETEDGKPRPVAVSPDPRVCALILLAPACGWFWRDDALADIDLPIMLRTAEKDERASHLHADLIPRGVRNPGRVDHQTVPNAGHHSFQSPFPPAMTRPDFPPSQDPAGFDRLAYQAVLLDEILAFLHDKS
ncbi:alpha/beta hydrolase family protein [Zavarzinella formosa]|uniref:alpha/beta hydrolase family protein n=1 Tax=Zavarzinella formosa TaxID=360055 RepID=UPI0003646401|nr:alpha/beta fold hydrolase [Zavarzinella formosa]